MTTNAAPDPPPIPAAGPEPGSAAMFGVSLAYLMALSGVLHFHGEATLASAQTGCAFLLAALHGIVALETFVRLARCPQGWRSLLPIALMPPLRLVARDPQTGRTVWLPRLGRTAVDEDLADRLERAFSLPMIGIALLVLPVFALEQFAEQWIRDSRPLAIATELATAGIWVAFAAEFLVMVSVVERKARYCREHWIDVAVILLPLVAFLRVGRLGRLLRLQQVTKTARVYRLRGTLMKLWQALLLIDAVDRMVRGAPPKRLVRLRAQVEALEEQLAELRAEIAALEAGLGPASKDAAPDTVPLATTRRAA